MPPSPKRSAALSILAFLALLLTVLVLFESVTHQNYGAALAMVVAVALGIVFTIVLGRIS